MAGKVVHKIHWTPIIIIILLIAALGGGFYFYQKQTREVEEARIAQAEETARVQRIAEEFKQHTVTALNDERTWLRLIANLTRTRGTGDFKYAVSDYLSEHDLLMMHLENYLAFLDENKETLQLLLGVEDFYERWKAAEDGKLRAIGMPELLEEQLQRNDVTCESNIYNCADFSTQAEAQAVFDACPTDVHKLDRDNDRIPCETLP